MQSSYLSTFWWDLRKIEQNEVHVLVDCRVAHNFISQFVVTNLNTLLTETANYRVVVAMGVFIKGKGICLGVI